MTVVGGNVIYDPLTTGSQTVVGNANVTGNVTAANHVGNVVYPDASVQTSAASPYVLKNRIINGAMAIDQRAAGASTTPSSSGYYSCDRWQSYMSASSKYSVQQNAGSVTPPTGYKYYLGITSTSPYTVGSGETFSINQQIEGYNIADLGWGTANAQTVTLSFWVRSSLTGTFGGAFRNDNGDRSYPFTYTISSANTWEQKSITIAGSTTGTWLSTNGSGIQIWMGLGVGSTYSGTAGSWASADYRSATGATSVVGTNGATWYVTGVQLEIGSTATPFERRMITTELQLCQRYFCSTFPLGVAPQQNYSSSQIMLPVSASNYACGWTFPVQMRTAPNITTYNPYNTNASFRVPNSSTDIAVTASGISAVDISYFACTLTAPSALHANMSANAEL
jgi:hypothetical protein